MESFVLAHVGQVWCNQIHFARAELACGVRGKNQKQELRIRMGQRANQIHDLAGRFAMQSDIALAIGESARFDAADIAACTDARRAPRLVVRVTVQAAYLHCAKAFMRSRLWDPATRVDRSLLPTIGQMIADQTGLQVPAETQEHMARRYAPDL